MRGPIFARCTADPTSHDNSILWIRSFCISYACRGIPGATVLGIHEENGDNPRSDRFGNVTSQGRLGLMDCFNTAHLPLLFNRQPPAPLNFSLHSIDSRSIHRIHGPAFWQSKTSHEKWNIDEGQLRRKKVRQLAFEFVVDSVWPGS